MPNEISRQDCENLSVPEPVGTMKLVRAGAIRPYASGGACHAHVDDLWGCVLYAHVVDGHAMKFGTTSSFKDRINANAKTINDILLFQDGRSTSTAPWLQGLAHGKGDQFKKQAPAVIRAGQSIEVWAASICSPKACQNLTGPRNNRCAACKALESTLNGRYQTIQYGWALRLS